MDNLDQTSFDYPVLYRKIVRGQHETLIRNAVEDARLNKGTTLFHATLAELYALALPKVSEWCSPAEAARQAFAAWQEKQQKTVEKPRADVYRATVASLLPQDIVPLRKKRAARM